MSLEDLLSQIKKWAEQQQDIKGVLLVGSYARGTARADSDVDLVILTDNPGLYINSISFAAHFGPISKWEKENWGNVTSLRVWYQDGLEIEYGFTLPGWGSEPLDPGTRQVISDGLRIVFDRGGETKRLLS